MTNLIVGFVRVAHESYYTESQEAAIRNYARAKGLELDGFLFRIGGGKIDRNYLRILDELSPGDALCMVSENTLSDNVESLEKIKKELKKRNIKTISIQESNNLSCAK